MSAFRSAVSAFRSSDLADQVDAIGERLIQYERKNRQPQPLHREFASSFAEGFRKGYREHD